MRLRLEEQLAVSTWHLARTGLYGGDWNPALVAKCKVLNANCLCTHHLSIVIPAALVLGYWQVHAFKNPQSQSRRVMWFALKACLQVML